MAGSPHRCRAHGIDSIYITGMGSVHRHEDSYETDMESGQYALSAAGSFSQRG